MLGGLIRTNNSFQKMVENSHIGFFAKFFLILLKLCGEKEKIVFDFIHYLYFTFVFFLHEIFVCFFFQFVVL